MADLVHFKKFFSVQVIPELMTLAGKTGKDSIEQFEGVAAKSIGIALKRGEDVNSQDSQGNTILHIAAALGFTRIVNVILEPGHKSRPNLAIQSKDGNTVLHYASGSSLGVVALELLLKDPAARETVNMANIFGECPLHLAAKEGLVTVMETLMRNGANPRLKDAERNSVMQHATRRWNDDAVRFLLQKGVQIPDDCGHLDLHLAVRDGDYQKVKELLRQNPSLINIKDVIGRNALFLAIMCEKESIAKHLLAYDVKQDCQVPEYPMLLMAITAGFSAQTLDKLLENIREKINRPDAQGLTLLFHAATSGRKEMVEWAIGKGAEVFKSKEPVLIAAIDSGSEETAKYVLGLDYVDPAATMDTGRRTPLHAAAQIGLLSIVKQMLDLGLDPNAKNNTGLTPIHFAPLSSAPAVLEELCQRGADPNILGAEGANLMHYAVGLANVKMVETALRFCPRHFLVQKNAEGETPFNSVGKAYYIFQKSWCRSDNDDGDGGVRLPQDKILGERANAAFNIEGVKALLGQNGA